MHLRQRQVRVDHGWSLLPQVRTPRAAILAGTVDALRICTQADMHVYPDMQTVQCVQTMGIRLKTRLSAHRSAYYMKFWGSFLRHGTLAHNSMRSKPIESNDVEQLDLSA